LLALSVFFVVASTVAESQEGPHPPAVAGDAAAPDLGGLRAPGVSSPGFLSMGIHPPVQMPVKQPAESVSEVSKTVAPAVASQADVAALPAPVQPSAVQPPRASAQVPGCLGQGLQTILSPDCMARVGVVPPRLAATMAGVPLPSPPGSAGVAAPAPYAVPASVRTTVASQPVAPAVPPGLACHVTGQSGDLTSFRAADADACLRGAFGMVGSSAGRFSVVLIDDYGHTVNVGCAGSSGFGKPTCSVR
jgi:hypothetical protein